MTVHLEPCPFCGCELTRGRHAINQLAVCATPGCHGGKQAIALDDPAQVAAWNRRPPSPCAALLSKAVEYLDTGFSKTFDHLDGCLFKADRRMPCQCGYSNRMYAFRDEVLAFVKERRATAEKSQ